MRAIILAAGQGSRLKQITNKIPKPMIHYHGKPILWYNIETCIKNNIKDVFINVHHLQEKIIEYFGDGSKFGINIIYSYEELLLGTAGAVRKILIDYGNQFPENEFFFVIYGDNYSKFPISEIVLKAESTKSDAVIAFHWREDTASSGVAEFDNDGTIKNFIEKPTDGTSKSKWVNAGIYYLKPSILKFIPEGNSDFAKDVFPAIVKNNKIYGVCRDVPVLAFDTLVLLNKNLKNNSTTV